MQQKTKFMLVFASVSLVMFGLGSPAANAQPKVAGVIGSTVSDGDMSFKVQSLKCGIRTVGTGFLEEKALGQFCVVTLTIKAAKKKAVSYFSSSQKGLTKSGAEVESKSLMDDQYQSMVDLNPGISLSTKIAFDVAKNDPLTKILFHDSMFSGGVLVDLTKTLKKK
jgi:hypothetical protein